MAAGNTICLPEPLEDGDAKSWFRRFDVCAAANEWNAAKKLVRLPTLFRGRAWATYESLGEADNEDYDALKGAVTVICVSPGIVFPAHISLGMCVSPHIYH